MTSHLIHFMTSTPSSMVGRRKAAISMVLCTTVGLSGCGNDDNSAVFNTAKPPITSPQVYSDAALLADPVVVRTLTPTELSAAMSAANLTNIAEPKCGVTIYRYTHSTTGLKGENTNATGAVMLPARSDVAGSDANACTKKRPVTLYAHGTSIEKGYDLSAIDDPSNPAYDAALLVAATFAAQGDITIAPNYPGYAGSDLSYAPYVTKQQGTQMLDGLQAGLLTVAADATVEPNDTLFVTGYSQGGYVAMATAKALDDIGRPATAVSPASGPYAVAAFADAILSGNGIVGGTQFLPLLTGSYDVEYGNLSDGAYNPMYSGSSSLFPTNEKPNSVLGKNVPLLALFESAPTDYPILANISPPTEDNSLFFSEQNYLFATDFRADYVTDMRANPDGIYPIFDALNPSVAASDFAIRQAFVDNDLRDYEPKSPMLLCGAHNDPTVTFDINTYAQALIWQDKNVEFAMIDLDANNVTERTNAGYQTYLSTLPTDVQRGMEQALYAEQQAFTANLDNFNIFTYHTAAAPYCLRTANAFFEQYR